MAASIGIRIARVRSLCKISIPSSSASSLSSRSSASASSASSVRSLLGLPHPATSTSSRFLRRELSSLLPLHSAVASARLVSKLPDDAVSIEGRFVNYLSPI